MRSLLVILSIMWTLDALQCRRFGMAFQAKVIRTRHNSASASPYNNNNNNNNNRLSKGVASLQVSKAKTESSSLLPRVLLKRNRQSKSFRDGSQLVFTNSISKTFGSVKMASLVQVEVPASADANNTETQTVGWGVYNPISMYRVRMLCNARPSSLAQQLQNWNKKQPSNEEDTKSGGGGDGSSSSSSSSSSSGSGKSSSMLLKVQEEMLSVVLKDKFQKAVRIRQAMGWPSSTTDTYRLVNGEGDELSGLAVDIIGGKVAVVMSSAAWCQIYQTLITTTLEEVLPHHDVVWKTTPSRLRQDGYEMETNDGKNDDDDDDDEAVEGSKANYDEDQPVIGMENGVKYQVFPYRLKGQKTSVYCDQRENRFNVAQLCQGKKVLDLCCYHGGFALNAALNGRAAHVIGVDSSQDAIETCMSNAKLNGITSDDNDVTTSGPLVEFVQADISTYMQSCREQFDVIVLDPPKLAPSVKDLDRATRKYHSLNRDAIKLISDDGGHFMTCTCSAAMTQKDGGTAFLQMVQQASLAARREITLLRVSGAAPCHTQAPVSFPAGNYLTVALFHVHPK
jgi:23S rRNA G2069 N7-methylase RlmK/C1962 C5-methylase RlmI